MMINDEALVQHYAVEGLQQGCSRGEVTTLEAIEALKAFGGIPYTRKTGVVVYLFVGQIWDVEIITSPERPGRCILWRAITPG